MKECEICGDNDWLIVDSNWVRCNRCGRLESRTPKRVCICCGKTIGKYAKATQQTCIKCKEANVPFESQIPCKTPACGNRLGKRADPSGFCRQCLREKDSWEVEDGHLWKPFALSMMGKPTGRNVLLKRLRKQYPDITENTLFNWLLRQTKAGVLKRVGHGKYQALTNGSPSPSPSPEESPTSIRLDPDCSSGWGPFRLIRNRAPDD